MEDFRNNIEKYKDLDWQRLLRKDLGDYSLEIVEKNLLQIKKIFDTIIYFPGLKKLPEDYKIILSKQLTRLFLFAEALSGNFQNITERKNWIDSVIKNELNFWNSLKPIIDYIEFISPKEESNKNISSQIESLSEKITKAATLGEELIKNSEKYIEAGKIADNWIEKQGQAIVKTLQNKSAIFDQKANNEHSSKKALGWLFGAVISAGVSVSVLMLFIFGKSGNELTVGSSLLRISILVVVSYFTVFCIQQFSNHRKLYEAYKFKAISLSTMEELVNSYSGQKDREMILDKAMSIIFNEPSLKEDDKYKQRMLDEMIDIVKKKI